MSSYIHWRPWLALEKFFLLVPWSLGIFSCQMQFGPDSQAEMLNLTHGMWSIRVATCTGDNSLVVLGRAWSFIFAWIWELAYLQTSDFCLIQVYQLNGGGRKGKDGMLIMGREKLDRKKMMIILISPKQNKKPIFAQSGHVYAMLVNNNPLKYLMF